MDHAVNRGLMTLAAGLLLAGATLGALAAPSVTTSSGAARQKDQETLAAFRQYVWLIYSSSAAIGPDARGRTVAQDIATWVLPDEARRSHSIGGGSSRYDTNVPFGCKYFRGPRLAKRNRATLESTCSKTACNTILRPL